MSVALIIKIAEFRGPGIHHNFDDSDSGYDVDMDQKKKPSTANQRGRIILLGDGTEVLTDSDDTEMFDHQEEDKDLASQVSKGPAKGQEESKPAATEEKTSSTTPETKPAANSFLTNSIDTSETKAENTIPK